jgi:hypothetical protein
MARPRLQEGGVTAGPDEREGATGTPIEVWEWWRKEPQCSSAVVTPRCDAVGRSVSRCVSTALPQGEYMATCTSAASVWTCPHMTAVANALELCGHVVEQGFWIRLSLVLSASQRHICTSVFEGVDQVRHEVRLVEELRGLEYTSV